MVGHLLQVLILVHDCIGAEVFLNSLLLRLESDISMTMSALHCLKVEPNLRKRIAESLIPNSKLKVMDTPITQLCHKLMLGYRICCM
jgi:hypothetical protein